MGEPKRFTVDDLLEHLDAMQVLGVGLDGFARGAHLDPDRWYDLTIRFRAGFDSAHTVDVDTLTLSVVLPEDLTEVNDG